MISADHRAITIAFFLRNIIAKNIPTPRTLYPILDGLFLSRFRMFSRNATILKIIYRSAI